MPPGLYPVRRSAFSGELGWRCGTPESRWSLCRDTRSSPCMSAMTACPPCPSSNTRLFTMSCSHSPSCRAASFVPPRSVKAYSKRPTSSPASCRMRMAGASFFPYIPLPPDVLLYGQEIPDIRHAVDCFSRRLLVPRFALHAEFALHADGPMTAGQGRLSTGAPFQRVPLGYLGEK